MLLPPQGTTQTHEVQTFTADAHELGQLTLLGHPSDGVVLPAGTLELEIDDGRDSDDEIDFR